MSKPPCFFVQNFHVDRITIPVAQFAHREGIALEDRSTSSTFDPEDCGIDWDAYGPILPCGSVQLVRHLKRSKRLGRYIHHDDISFGASTWQETLGNRMLNADGRVVLAREVPAILAKGDAHIRPNAEDKVFHARVFDLPQWNSVVEERGLSPETSCWLSSVKPIKAEWRCWIVGGRLVEASQYRQDGQKAWVRGVPPEVTAFVEQVATTWLPAPCVVVDIADTAEGLRVLEFNPIHGAGWYAADVPTILRAWLAWSVENLA